MLDSDTEIYIFYPHPTVKIFNNIDLFNLYKSKKELDIKKLKLISDKTKITVIDTFAMICDLENCLNDNYENNFTDGSHFTIETNKLVSKKIKEILF